MTDGLTALKRLRVWTDEPLLREVVERWQTPATKYGFAQASLDIGLLVGILTRREEQRDLGTSNTYELSEEYAEAIEKIQFLVNYMHGRGLLPEGTFTFPDGETFTADV